MSALDMFMWGFQPHFQILANGYAERIFHKLLPGLNSRAFLIGIWEDESSKPTTYQICLEPEDCGYEKELFQNVKQIAAGLEASDPERRVFHSDPTAQENHLRRIKLRSLKNAVLSILQPRDEQDKLISFASFPVKVEGYWVCVILQMNKEKVHEVYSLKNRVIDERYPISVSLLDAAITEFLEGCAKALLKPNPGSELSILDRDENEMIRSAGNRLMRSLSLITHSYYFNLFELCNLISAERYEGSDGNGKMVIARRNHKAITEVITLKSPVSLNNHRAVRKLLEMANDELCLLSDANEVYGLGTVKNYDASDEDLFTVKFTKHFTWELIHHDSVMMMAAYREPQFLKEKINRLKFSTDIQRIFPSIQTHVIDKLWDVITAAMEQKHGTMVVISSGAETEAERLEKQSTRITPVEITPEIVKLVTAIDGAVLISPDGICYAIGVILDGLASDKGDPARGARFNSAIRYIYSQCHQCMIVVISEDGYINLIPDLMPRIKRELIDLAISELSALSKEEDIKVKNFNQLMGWCQAHQFYLLEKDCEKINELRKEIEQKLNQNLRIVYKDFHPNPEMNDSYYV